MTVRTINQMTLMCDCCETIFDDTPRGEGNQLDKAQKAGWRVHNGYHYCPVCMELPEGN